MKAHGDRCWKLGCSAILLGAMIAGQAFADGSETLGPPVGLTIETGSGIVAKGAGMNSGAGTIELEVPAAATVKQVLLYWEGFSAFPSVGDDTITVNGMSVTGALIGGWTQFYVFPPGVQQGSTTYRADVTALNLVAPGLNSLDVTDLDFGTETDGIGAFVIYEEAGMTSDIAVLDGNDLAYSRFAPPLDETVPQTFTFDAAATDRPGQIVLSVGNIDPSLLAIAHVTIAGTTLEYPLTNTDGDRWDTIYDTVNIPAGATEVTAQVFSGIPPDSTPNDASLAWVLAVLSVPTEEQEPECVECDGGVSDLTLRYTGTKTNANVIAYKGLWPFGSNILFNGTLNPGDTFTLSSGDPETALPKYITIKVRWHFNALIFTDCRMPIGPGAVHGDFEVVAATNVGGGEICPYDQPPDFCDEGRPQVLTLRYTGEGCDASAGSGLHWLNHCWGDPEGVDPVYIVAADRFFVHPGWGTTWFSGPVNLGDTFEIDATSAGEDHLGGSTWIFIFSGNPRHHGCDLLQKVRITTSCWLPILEGSQFGSLELVGYTAE